MVWSPPLGKCQLEFSAFCQAGKGADQDQLEASLAAIADKNFDKDDQATTIFLAEPLEEMHFGETYSGTSVSKVFLNGLVFIGLIILILATLNFVNLETAMAIGRSKEVGIRKTLGGRRWELIYQFLVETYLLVISAGLIGLVLAELIKNLYSDYLPSGFTVEYLQGPNLAFYALFPMVLAALSGIYPALILSSYQPVRAIKGERVVTTGFSLGVFLRKISPSYSFLPRLPSSFWYLYSRRSFDLCPVSLWGLKNKR